MEHLKTAERILIWITIIASFFGGVAWLTKQDFSTDANAKSIVEIKDNQRLLIEKLDQNLSEINRKLGRIEGILEATK